MHETVEIFATPSDERISGRRSDTFCISMRAFFVLATFALLVSGCGLGVRTIWSTQVKSPDGQWIASGRSELHSGPGNAAIQTGVYLKRADSSLPEETILLFFNQTPGSKGAIKVKVSWLSPSHVQVTLSGHPDLDVQVIRYAGIDISIEEPPAAAANS